MNCIKKTLFLSVFLLSGFTLQAQDGFVTNYLEAKVATMHGESNEDDVKQLTAMYHDDVIYEHPKAGFKLETKAVLEKGKVSFLKSYGGKKGDAKTRLINQMQTENTYIIEFEIEFLTQKNETIKRRQIQVLELTDQKVKRIIDYW